MLTDDIQVLIVGAGVGGLSVATVLRAVGLEPVVIERDDRPTTDTDAGRVTLWPETLGLFDRLGLAADLEEVGTRVTRWSLRRPDGSVDARRRATGTSGVVAVGYRRLCDRLAAALPGDTLHEETALEAIEDGAGDASVRAAFGNGVRESFDLLVGADGADSRVRRHVGGAAPVCCGTASLPVRLDGTATVGEATEVWTPGGVLRVLPGEEGATGWLAVPTDRPVASGATPPTVADAAAEVDRLLPGGLATASTGAWRDDVRQRRDRWRGDRVALVGDAAHARHRLGEVGVLLALEDALVLAAELDRGGRPIPDRLASYATRRRCRLRHLERDTERFPPLEGIEGPLSGDSNALALRSGRLRGCFGDGSSEPTIEAPF